MSEEHGAFRNEGGSAASGAAAPDYGSARTEPSVSLSTTGLGMFHTKDLARVQDLLRGGKRFDPDERIGKYRLIRCLGGGTFGSVWAAVHESMDAPGIVPTCLKLLHAEGGDILAAQNEARAMASIRHDNVVWVKEAGLIPLEDGQEVCYIEMELVGAARDADFEAGRALSEVAWQDGKPRLKPRQLAQIMIGICDGVHAAHIRNRIHRDLKPQNIIVEPWSYKPKVTDFGISMAVIGANATWLGSRGLGTPAYVAPEQAKDGGESTHLSDVYGLGAILYFLLSGGPPYPRKPSESTAEAQRRILDELRSGVRPKPPLALKHSVPRALVRICNKAMAWGPAARYQSAAQMADDLRAWLEGRPMRDSGVLRRVALWAARNKAIAAMVFLAAAALVSWGAFLLVSARAATAVAHATVMREQDQFRALTIQRLQLLRRGTTRNNGWSADGWDLVKQAAAIRTDPALVDEAAATLGGLDAFHVKRFEKLGAQHVVFDASAERLLMSLEQNNGAHGGVAMWDAKLGRTQTFQTGIAGPVGFAANGSPIQLQASRASGREVLVLKDLVHDKVLRKVNLPGALFRGDGDLTSTYLAPDGGMIAANVADENGSVGLRVWNVADGQVVCQLDKSATAVAFSSNGALLAAGNVDGGIGIWSLRTGKIITSLPAREKTMIESLAFGRDTHRSGGDAVEGSGWLLASGEHGGAVVIWDLAGRSPRSRCLGSAYDVYAVAFSPDGMTLASCGRAPAKLWDVDSGQLLLNIESGNFMSSLCFSSDGRRLAIGAVTRFDPGQVNIWQLDNGRGQQTLRGLEGQVEKVQFSFDGHLLAALSQEWQAAIWDLRSGWELWRFDVPQGGSADNAAFALSRNRRQFAFCSGSRAKMWDLATGKELNSWNLPDGNVDVMAFDPSGKLLLFRREQQLYRGRVLLDDHQLLALPDLRGFEGYIVDAAASPDGQYIVVDGWGDGAKRTIKAFDGLKGVELWSKPSIRPKGTSGRVHFDSAGTLVSGQLGGDDSADLYSMPDGRLIRRLPWGPSCMDPGAETWAEASSAPKYSPGISLLRAQERIPFITLGIDRPTSSMLMQFDPQGRHIAWGNADGTVSVCDLSAIKDRLGKLGLGW